MENQNNNQKQRGGCLTAFLIVFLIFGAFSLIGSLAGPAALKALGRSESLPSWYMPVSVIVCLIDIVGLILVLVWRKIGVFLYIASLVLDVVLSLATSTGNTAYTIGGVIGKIVVLVIFVALIRPVWNHLK